MKLHLVSIIAVFVAMLSAVIAEPPATKKPPVGVPGDAQLFNGKWYRVYLERGSWKAARDKCVQHGGHLVVIPDEATQAYLRTLAKGLLLWLGATDEKVEGLWVWVDGTEMKYTAWMRGQPSNTGGKERYLQMLWGAWNDAPESQKDVVGYICEWKDK